MRSAFTGAGEGIVCSACSSQVSEPWRNLLWLPILGFPIGYFVPFAIASHFQLSLFWEWVILGACFVVLLAMMYAFLPLSVQDQAERADKKISSGNDTSSGEQVVAVLRPYSSWDKVLFTVAVSLFFASVAAFRFFDFAVARVFFYSSVVVFVVFLSKRIWKQMHGELITLLEFSDDDLKILKLKNTPFLETEVDREITISVSKLKKIKVYAVGGVAADPSYSITFELWDGGIVNIVLPFHLGEQARRMIDVLRGRLSSVEFEVDKLFLK